MAALVMAGIFLSSGQHAGINMDRDISRLLREQACCHSALQRRARRPAGQV